MKVFVLGVPHTKTSLDFTTCAYTMKVYNLCRMLLKLGHHVIHMGVEGSTVPCSEHVSVIPESKWQETYGDRKPTEFYNISADGKFGRYQLEWGSRCNLEIRKRMDGDYESIIACTWGGPQIHAIAGVPQFAVETGIGYPHTFTKYRAFESYAWMHMHYGRDGKFGGDMWMDCVIPNAFDPEMFEFKEKKDDYFLYIGRLNHDKGVAIAVDAALAAGRKIKIVGQGDPTPFLKEGVEYLPPVGVEDRKTLMSNAACVLVPTRYIEPFGGVNVECQMSGTPVITTDWGAFPETVVHGVTGYRCKTLDHFIWAAKNIHMIKPQNCRSWAVNNFSLDRIGNRYEEFFQQVLNLRDEGWFTRNESRANLDFMRPIYPGQS